MTSVPRDTKTWLATKVATIIPLNPCQLFLPIIIRGYKVSCRERRLLRQHLISELLPNASMGCTLRGWLSRSQTLGSLNEESSRITKTFSIQLFSPPAELRKLPLCEELAQFRCAWPNFCIGMIAGIQLTSPELDASRIVLNFCYFQTYGLRQNLHAFLRWQPKMSRRVQPNP